MLNSLFFKCIPLLLALGVENFLAVVITTSLANAVAQNKLSALRALCHAGKAELPVVRASLISASLRYFLLRYCHYLHLLEALNNFVVLINLINRCFLLCQTGLQESQAVGLSPL